MHRRGLLASGGALVVTSAVTGAAAHAGDPLRARLAALEAACGGRIGVALVDTARGRRVDRRGDERFPLCSTFKLPLAAAILAQVDRGAERLDRPVGIAAADIVDNSPFSAARAGGTASVAELCAAAVTRSDNAAANLLLPAIGGPAGLTRFARRLGDHATRLDRIEPMLNEARPGDPRDTTTPLAMLGLLERLLLGRALRPESRRLLLGWMVASRTGARRMQAGLPAGWRIGDKTGAGEHGSDNEVAILWPPGRPPLLVASYLTGSDRTLAETNAVHARIGALIAACA